jgi:hypothetical protein
MRMARKAIEEMQRCLSAFSLFLLGLVCVSFIVGLIAVLFGVTRVLCINDYEV